MKVPGGGLGIFALIALVLGGGFILMKSKSNGGDATAAMYGARKIGGCGCGK